MWDLRKTYTTLKVKAIPVDKISHPQLEERSYGTFINVYNIFYIQVGILHSYNI